MTIPLTWIGGCRLQGAVRVMQIAFRRKSTSVPTWGATYGSRPAYMSPARVRDKERERQEEERALRERLAKADLSSLATIFGDLDAALATITTRQRNEAASRIQARNGLLARVCVYVNTRYCAPRLLALSAPSNSASSSAPSARTSAYASGPSLRQAFVRWRKFCRRVFRRTMNARATTADTAKGESAPAPAPPSKGTSSRKLPRRQTSSCTSPPRTEPGRDRGDSGSSFARSTTSAPRKLLS